MNKIEAVTVSTRQSWTGVLSLQKDSKKSKKKRSKPQIPAQEMSPSSPSANWGRSLVQISTLHQFPNFSHPWRHGLVHRSISSGVVVNRSSGLVLTTAGAVHYAERSPADDKCQVLVHAPGSPRPVAAYVIAVSHAADLALLQTRASSALRRSSQVKWSTCLPNLGHPVLAAGCVPSPDCHPETDQTHTAAPHSHLQPLSLPQLQRAHGVVSRVEVVQYNHSGASLLAFQVDAALKHDGCWGGGLFDARSTGAADGTCLGILLQRSSTEAWDARYRILGSPRPGRSPIACSSHGAVSEVDSESSPCAGGGNTGRGGSHASCQGGRALSVNLAGVACAEDDCSHSRRCVHTSSSSSSSSSSRSVLQPGRSRSSRRSTKQGPSARTGRDELGEGQQPWHLGLQGQQPWGTQMMQEGGADASKFVGSRLSVGGVSGVGEAARMVGSQGRPRGQADQGSVVHVVPACVVAHFLADLKAHSRCLGFPMPGFRYQTLTATALQAWLAVQHPPQGVCVTSVPGKQWGWSPLRVHDVIIAIDGAAVLRDGTVEAQPGLHVSLVHMLASKHVGDEAVLTILRGGKQLTLTCRPGAPQDLLPRIPPTPHTSTSFPMPGYMLVGRAALTALSLPGLEQLCGSAAKRALPPAWHQPAMLGFRGGARKRQGQDGQQVGMGEGVLWGGSNLVVARAQGLGQVRGAYVSKQQDSKPYLASSGSEGGDLPSTRCRSLRPVRDEVDSSRALACSVAAAVHRTECSVAAAVHGTECSEPRELVVFVEELQLPTGREQAGGVQEVVRGSISWPSCADLLVSVNGVEVLGLQHLATLCRDGEHLPDELVLEFASGHVTFLSKAQAVDEASRIAAAWGIDTYAMPV